MGGKSIGWKVLPVVDCAMARTESFSPQEANECKVEMCVCAALVCHGLDP